MTTTPWAIGAEIEYANGLHASVVYADGPWAVLEQKAPHGFLAVKGDPESFAFLNEANPLLPSCGAAVVQVHDSKKAIPGAPAISAYRTEFPDFDAATLPELPEGFADTSWANEACPCFTDEATGLVLYVDYAEAEKREFPEAPRFGLNGMVYDRANGWQLTNEAPLCVTDSWEEMLAEIEKAKGEGRELPEALRAEIKDRATGEAWIKALCDADMHFHLEDSPGTIICGGGHPTCIGGRLFRRADERLINERVAALYRLDWGPENECPIGFMLDVLGD